MGDQQQRSWNHTLDVINEDDGRLMQRRLFTDHKDALEAHLAAKWQDLFGTDYDIILYDLTSTGARSCWWMWSLRHATSVC